MDISFGIIVVCIVAQVARTRQADVVVSCETFREDQTYGTCTCTVDSTALTAVNCAQSKRPVEKVTITSTDMNGIQYDLCVYDNYTTGSISFNERFAICSDSPRISSGKYTLEFQIPTNKSLFLNADVDCQPTCFGNSGYELQTSYSGIPVKFGKIHKAVAMHCQSTACKGKDPVNCTCTVSSDKCVQKNGVTEMIMLTKDMQSTEHELCVYSNYTTGTVSTQGSSTVCSDIPQNSGNNYTLDVQIPTDKTNFDNPVFKCILVCPEESPDDTSDGPLEISILFGLEPPSECTAGLAVTCVQLVLGVVDLVVIFFCVREARPKQCHPKALTIAAIGLTSVLVVLFIPEGIFMNSCFSEDIDCGDVGISTAFAVMFGIACAVAVIDVVAIVVMCLKTKKTGWCGTNCTADTPNPENKPPTHNDDIDSTPKPEPTAATYNGSSPNTKKSKAPADDIKLTPVNATSPSQQSSADEELSQSTASRELPQPTASRELPQPKTEEDNTKKSPRPLPPLRQPPANGLTSVERNSYAEPRKLPLPSISPNKP